jgi:hypothetical protein
MFLTSVGLSNCNKSNLFSCNKVIKHEISRNKSFHLSKNTKYFLLHRKNPSQFPKQETRKFKQPKWQVVKGAQATLIVDSIKCGYQSISKRTSRADVTKPQEQGKRPDIKIDDAA